MGEVFTAARTMQEVDNSDFLDRVYDEEMRRVLDAVNDARRAEGLTSILPPSAGILPGGALADAPRDAFAAMGGLQTGTRREVAEALLREAARYRQGDPSFLAGVGTDVDAFLKPRIEREKARRREAGEVLAGAEGFGDAVAGFAGGMTKAMEDPVNIATLPVGGFGKTAFARVLSEAGAQGIIELFLTPAARENRAALGEELTGAEAAGNVALAMAGGALFQGLFEGGAVAVRHGAKKLRKLDRELARALEGADLSAVEPGEVLATILARESDPDLLADMVRTARGSDSDLTPEEADALLVLQRAEEIDAVNPYAPMGQGRAKFEDDLTRALDAVLANGTRTDFLQQARDAIPDRGGPVEVDVAPSTATPRPARGSGQTGTAPDIQADALGFDRAAVKRAIRGPESGGDDNVTNRAGSSASGRYQFTRGTFKSYYRKVYGASKKEADRAWQNQRFDPQVQERLMDALLDDNASHLRRLGVPVSTGNLYVVHVMGPGGAQAIFRAAPDEPMASVVRRYDPENAVAILRQNPTYFGKGQSASEAIAIMHRVVGGKAASVPARGGGATGPIDAGGGIDEAALLTDEAMQLRREAANIEGLGPVQFDRFDPDAIEVDAELMQFKAGGDEFGVTERLQGVDTWNPILAGRVVVWESQDGRRLIADGHQRRGLASRIAANDPAQDVKLDALVLRESDGWDAETARTWAALKNIAEGSGSPVDAAKVLRGIPREQWARYLPPRSALVRDAEGLVQLGDDAFGMVVNELVEASHAAVVGRLASDPQEQLALTQLLARLEPRSAGEAEGVIRQAQAAGFKTETQEDMFGALEVKGSLFVERARVLERGLTELRKLRGAFTSAARNADALEGAGNRIDKAASEKEVEANAEAIELVRRLAWSAGPVKQSLDRGAKRLADGERIGDVLAQFVADVRQLDLASLARAERSGEGSAGRGGADGSGRAGDAGEAGPGLRTGDANQEQPQLTPEGDPTDPVDGAWPSREELEAAGQEGFDLSAPGEPTRAFDTADSEGPRQQAESLEHDARAAIESAQRIDGGDSYADRFEQVWDQGEDAIHDLRVSLIEENPDDVVAILDAMEEARARVGRTPEERAQDARIAASRQQNEAKATAIVERLAAPNSRFTLHLPGTRKVLAVSDPETVRVHGGGLQVVDGKGWSYVPETELDRIAREVGVDPQADFAAPTQDQARIALERQGEGRQRAQVAQKAPGEDGGLFDNNTPTRDLFGDGADATFNIDGDDRALGDLLDEHDADRAAIEKARQCL
jgi:hypothetical protein